MAHTKGGFNPMAQAGGAVLGWLALLVAQVDGNECFWFNVEHDPRDEEGQYTTDGAAAVTVDLSVGKGRGSARFSFTGSELVDLIDVFESWTPPVQTGKTEKPSGDTSEKENVREIIEASLSKEDDGSVMYRTSNKPNSKSTRIHPEFLKLAGITYADLGLAEETEETETEGDEEASANVDRVAIAKSTLSRDSEGVTSFKLSEKRHTKSIRVPAGQWDAFLGFLVNLRDNKIPATVAMARQVIADEERKARREASRA